MGDRPLPAVLDTACVRTGLHYQLRNGTPPASVTTARDGKIRLFMELETLAETLSHLPRFAEQFGVTVADLRRMLAEDWLPHIQVVKLPLSLRKLDPRAADVRDKDADDSRSTGPPGHGGTGSGRDTQAQAARAQHAGQVHPESNPMHRSAALSRMPATPGRYPDMIR